MHAQGLGDFDVTHPGTAPHLHVQAGGPTLEGICICRSRRMRWVEGVEWCPRPAWKSGEEGDHRLREGCGAQETQG